MNTLDHTERYLVAMVNEHGEHIRQFATNDAEAAMKRASLWFAMMQDRTSLAIYRRAVFVDVMKRTRDGNYDGIAAFRVQT
jgi:hypothetical protein